MVSDEGRTTFMQVGTGAKVTLDGKWHDLKFVFGWDQMLQSFYLQKHDAYIEDQDANPVVWLGATADTRMYEVEDLVNAARKHGLTIPYETQVKLYGEKDDGV
jgi:hypothetical protein